MTYRTEKDTLGEVKVPEGAYYGAQTARAVANFPVSGFRLQPAFIRAQAVVKLAAALANTELGALPKEIGDAIAQAAREVLDGKFDLHFVVDAFQAGAGTSQNMNANEVIANRANEILGGKLGEYKPVNPNDHVNYGQSTNDTIPTAIRISALIEIEDRLLPAVAALENALRAKAVEFDGIVKSGRTHLQDAVPIRLGQEFGAYATMIAGAHRRISQAMEALRELPLGGSAVGTGLNTAPGYRKLVVKHISEITGKEFRNPPDFFEAMSSFDAIVQTSGAIRVLLTSLKKIADDFRLLASGPRTGFYEIVLPTVQPGSSIMPGKVNPVLAEMLNMVVSHCMGLDAAIVHASQAGQLELNVMMPVIAFDLLQLIQVTSGGIAAFTDKCVAGIVANEEICRRFAEKSPSLATALNVKIGYAEAAKIAKEAMEKDELIRDLVREKGLLTEAEIAELLDLRKMTEEP